MSEDYEYKIANLGEDIELDESHSLDHFHLPELRKSGDSHLVFEVGAIYFWRLAKSEGIMICRQIGDFLKEEARMTVEKRDDCGAVEKGP